jgi:hypothetical protein
VSAYSIAFDILGRGSSFDAAIDPIVRIEMSRLRSSLVQYYEAFGAGCDLSIHIPKGRYMAVFGRVENATRDALPSAHAEAKPDETPSANMVPESAEEPGGEDPSPMPAAAVRLLPSALMIAAAAATVAVAIWYGLRPDFIEKPMVAVEMLAIDKRLDADAIATRDFLLSALSQFQTLNLASGKLRKKSLATSLRPSPVNSYIIDLKYHGHAGERSVWWQIVDSESGELLQSGLEDAGTEGALASIRKELITSLSQRFAGPRGIINRLELNNHPQGNPGNACVLQAEYELDDGDLNELKLAADCLEKTVAADPGNTDAMAVLSRVVARLGRDSDARAITRSLALANRAVSLAPLSDRAYIALMIALDAYRQQNWSRASLLAEQVNCSDLVVSALRAASLGQLGSDHAAQRLEDARALHPDFEKSVSDDMSARKMQPALFASIKVGLEKAGAQIVAEPVLGSF